MLPGQEVSAVVENLGFQGEGVCRIDGFVVFVPFALPGEKVLLKIKDVKKNHATADLVKIVAASSDRQVPVCLSFGKCGGCSMQHLPYDRQLGLKRQGVENTLSKIAGIQATVHPVIGMKEPWHYRNKTVWQVVCGPNGYEAGFYAGKSHKVIPAERCAIASDLANRAVSTTLAWLNKRFPHPERRPACPVSQIVTRNSREEKLMLLLGCVDPTQPCLTELAEHLGDSLPEIASVFAYPAHDGSKVPLHLYGESALDEKTDGLTFSLSPFSFFQVNHDIMDQMYGYALSQADQDGNDALIDVYSGIGTLSLLAAKRFRRVTGLELSESAVRDARVSAMKNGLSNAAFVSGYAEKELPKLTATGLKAGTVILDPPKKGAHLSVLSAIMDAGPQRVVYISCHPASQARDAAILIKGGYEPSASQPFDMFPQTGEIENVMTFRRRMK